MPDDDKRPRVTTYELAKRIGLDPIPCRKCGLRTGTSRLLADLFRAIEEVIVEGGVVEVTGFGVFEPKVVPGRVINSGIVDSEGLRKVEVPPSLVLKFRQSRTLRERINPDREKSRIIDDE